MLELTGIDLDATVTLLTSRWMAADPAPRQMCTLQTWTSSTQAWAPACLDSCRILRQACYNTSGLVTSTTLPLCITLPMIAQRAGIHRMPARHPVCTKTQAETHCDEALHRLVTTVKCNKITQLTNSWLPLLRCRQPIHKGTRSNPPNHQSV